MDTLINLIVKFAELRQLFFIRTFERCWIFKIPMGVGTLCEKDAQPVLFTLMRLLKRCIAKRCSICA